MTGIGKRISNFPMSFDLDFVNPDPDSPIDMFDGAFGDMDIYPIVNLGPEQARDFFKEVHAQEYIDSVAIYHDGRLDIAATAAGLGIPVVYQPPEQMFLSGGINGTGENKACDPLKMRLRSNLGFDTNVTFGHEIG